MSPVSVNVELTKLHLGHRLQKNKLAITSITFRRYNNNRLVHGRKILIMIPHLYI